jgi:hypothetical protein
MEYELEQDKLEKHGTVYFKAHNKTLKSHLRGITRGLLTGMTYGGLVGVGLLGASALLPFSIPVSIIASLAALGAITGSELMGHIGTSAGTVSSVLAEKEIRLRYPSLPAISPDSPEPGVGYHAEIPPGRDRGKFYHLKTGLAGAALGASVGALFGIGGLAEHLFSHETFHMMHQIFHAGATQISIAAGALFGAQFGVNRGIFKTIFNYTDSLFEGRIGGPSKAQIARERERYTILEQGERSEVTSLQRQEEFYRLQNGYYKAAFNAGFSGNARGLLAGMVSGAMTGLAFGALLTVIGFGAGAVALSMAVGAGVMSNIFAKTTAEPALHIGAEEVFEQRIHALKQGQDISFEVAQERAAAHNRAQADMNAPDGAQQNKSTWIKPKIMLIGAVTGALIGAILAPVTGGFLLSLAGLETTAAALGMAPIAAKIAVASSAMGLTGALFGMGDKPSKILQNTADYIYLGTLSPEQHPDIRTTTTPPLMESNSPLLKHGKALDEAARAKVEQTIIRPILPEQEKNRANVIALRNQQMQPGYLQDILNGRKEQAMEQFRERIKRETKPQPLSHFVLS